MADKYTITLWPPEHGAKPHIPIEVGPDQVDGMKAQGWRDKDPNVSELAAFKESESRVITPPVRKKPRGKKSPSAEDPPAEDSIDSSSR